MMAKSKANNFDLVRLVLAWIVVYVHLFQITDVREYAIFYHLFSSSFAVKGFFAISGYLVTQSYLNSHSLTDFAERRVRRIFPAYIAIVLISFVAGIYFTTVPLKEYFASMAVWKYLLANLMFLNFWQPTLPGVFADQAVAAMNPALWTIKIELCLYVCLPLIVWGFKKYGVWPVTAILYVLSVSWLFGLTSFADQNKIFAELGRQFPGQMSYFVFGGALAMAPLSSKKMWIASLLTGLAWYLSSGLAKAFVEPAFFALSVLTVAIATKHLGNFGKFGDISYGTYIFHSIVIHILFALGVIKGGPGNSPWFGVVATTVGVAILALCSWRWLEKPFLKRGKSHTGSATIKEKVAV
jgi:peptidoglycan/LPS O-acetylase OafA/YrhL